MHQLYLTLVKSFVELVKFIFTIPGVKFFLSERLCQDPIENYFGCQRQRGGRHENPNVNDFCKNSQALKVVNSICGTVSKGNCRGKKQAIDVEIESRPLKKRCKAKDRDKTYSKLIKPPRVFKSKVKLLTSRKLRTSTAPRKGLFRSLSMRNPVQKEVKVDTSVNSSDKPHSENVQAVVMKETVASDVLSSHHMSHESCTHSQAESNVCQHGSVDMDIESDKEETQANSHAKDQVTETRVFFSCSAEDDSGEDDDMISKALGPGPPEEQISSHHMSYESCSHSQAESNLCQHASVDMDIESDKEETQANSHAKDQVTETRVFFSCSAEDDDMISKALGPGPPEEELSRCCTISIRREDMWTLKMSGWLNDQVRKIMKILIITFF